MKHNPDDWFSPDESQRRMEEVMRRMSGRPPQMDMATGQNLKEPFLKKGDLIKRGYPCTCGFK